jgi:hypothetical protein
MGDTTIETKAARPFTCRLCGKVFATDLLKTATIIGANPQAKLQQINAILADPMKHLQRKHSYQLSWAQLMGGEYAGLLAMGFFECDAEVVEQQRDYARWKIHTLTTRVAITDERIAERLYKTVFNLATDIHALGARSESPEDPRVIERVTAETELWMKSPLALAILETMKTMRDVLQEKDRYVMTDGPPPIEPSGHTGNSYPEPAV